MLKSCTYCNRIHDSKYDCGKKPKRMKQGNEKDRFRWTQAWQRKRDEIKERDLYLCQVCKTNGKYQYNNLEVHHITPLEERFELRLDNDNLITLCSECHEKAENGSITRAILRSMISLRNE